MSFRNLLAALVAVSLAGCLLPVQAPSDGKPALPDGGVPSGTGDGGNNQTQVLTTVVVSINGSDSVAVGQPLLLSAQALDQTNAGIDDGTLTYTWTFPGTGTVNIDTITGVQAQPTATGAGQITATCTVTRLGISKVGTKVITITPPPPELGSLTIPTAPAQVEVGTPVTVPFVARDTNGELVDQSQVSLGNLESNTNVLVVGGGSGNVTFTGITGGTSTWTVHAKRLGGGTDVTATGTITVTVPTAHRIVVGSVTQTTAGNCLPTQQWGSFPGNSGTVTAVAVSDACGAWTTTGLTWTGTPGIVNVTGGANGTASYTITGDGTGTITAKSSNDNGATFTATLEVTSRYPLVIQVDGSCTQTDQQLNLTVGETKTLKLAKYKGAGNCDSSDVNVTWSRTSGNIDLSSTSGSQVTVTAVAAGVPGNVNAFLTAYSQTATVPYAVSNVPAPVFGAGSLTASWTSAKHFDLTWPAATLSGGTITYKLSGSSALSGGKYAEQVVSGTSKSVDVGVAAADWNFTIQACNGSTTSCAALTQKSYSAESPSTGSFVVLGSDHGYYSLELNGASNEFLGLPFTAPAGGIATAPRRDVQGNLYGIAYVNAGEQTVQVQKAFNSTSTTFNAATVDLGFSIASCTAANSLELSAFPVAGSQLAFISGSSRLTCGTGELVVTPFSNASQSLVASGISSSAAAGAALDKLAYIYRGTLFVVDAATASTATPTVLASSVSGQLLGSSNGLYTLASGSLKQFDTTTTGQTGNTVTLTGDFTVAGIDATKPAYGLPSGQLVFTTIGGFGVATPTDATHFTTQSVSAPSLSGVTFTLGTMVTP